ncbi:Uncharacterised protein [uncultured archaeon]|nr:Uncharacterised protein [uncultured archaeon]
MGFKTKVAALLAGGTVMLVVVAVIALVVLGGVIAAAWMYFGHSSPTPSSGPPSTYKTTKSSSTLGTTTTTLPQAQNVPTTTTEPIPTQTTTTVSPPQTVEATTTTVASSGSQQLMASCVNQYGVSSDTVLYLYTRHCCDPTVTNMVNAVERKGFPFKHIDTENPSDTDADIIACFIQKGNSIYVPQFICPATQGSSIMTNPAGMQAAIERFAEDCVKQARGGAANTDSAVSGEVKCRNNSDCGVLKTSYICVNGNVYLKKELPICRNPGTPQSTCVTNIGGMNSAVDTCNDKERCVAGQSTCQLIDTE